MKNLSISLQLKIAFSLMFFFVLILSTLTYLQTNQIHKQTETMFNHPFVVRNAIDQLRSDVYMIHWALESVFKQDDYKKMKPFLEIVEKHEKTAMENFNILFDRYLGPHIDIENLFSSFHNCKNNRESVIRFIEDGDYGNAALINVHSNSNVNSDHLDDIVRQIDKISAFTKSKADELNSKSHDLNKKLNQQLLIIVLIILTLTVTIIVLLLNNIRKPLLILTSANQQFKNGNLNFRSSFVSKNELGNLSESFNILAETVQNNLELNQKVNEISMLMLSEDDARKFFHSMLSSLAINTGSQMAAVYLLSDDQKRYEHFQSIGLDETATQTFEINNYMGELGSAVANRKVQHIKNIPGNTRFAFLSVSGKFIPREMITIPVIAANDILAVISLASLNKYSTQSLELIEKLFLTLSTRVAGILAYRKMKEFSAMLEQQNAELEAQKSELFAQSVELSQQNAELEMQKNQLDEASRLKTNFLSNMSHELRTPLNSVIALSGVLNRRLARKIPDDEYSYIEVIERNGKHLLSLINDILDISRIEAGHEEIETTTFDVNRLIDEVINLIKPQATQKGIELIHQDSDAPVTLASDSGKVMHILQNLIGNAVKFTEKGHVTVTTMRVDDVLKIKVSDTGIGIDPRHQMHIFDEFRQADGSTSRKFGGTGLGLAIAKKYANLLGGNITVKSIPEEGSEFVVILPMKYSSEKRNQITETEQFSKFARIKPVEKFIPGGYKKSILLVEDSEPAIVQMKDILEDDKFSITIARNGAEALKLVEQFIPDAIILDLMMPEIDGFEVLKTLRSTPRTTTIPVLILTAKHITKEELKVLKGNNIFQLIQKGDVNRAELLNAVHEMSSHKVEETKPVERAVQPIEGKPVVLVVEDNPDNLLTVKALLDKEFTIIEAVNGNESVAKAKQHVPHLILMDIALPGMDGIDAFKIIRNDTRLHHIPIIALTASAMTSDREVILAYGFDAYISKPLDEKEFFKTINNTLYGK